MYTKFVINSIAHTYKVAEIVCRSITKKNRQFNLNSKRRCDTRKKMIVLWTFFSCIVQKRRNRTWWRRTLNKMSPHRPRVKYRSFSANEFLEEVEQERHSKERAPPWSWCNMVINAKPCLLSVRRSIPRRHAIRSFRYAFANTRIGRKERKKKKEKKCVLEGRL